MAVNTDDSVRWPRGGRFDEPLRRVAWGTDPRAPGGKTPERTRTLRWLGPFLAAAALGCTNKAEQQTYDPIALGMVGTDAPTYDDGDAQIFEVKRPISLPVLPPTDAQRAMLQTPVPPYERTPWITKNDVKVQVSWTLSNLDKDYHNVEILLDPWNEFARYTPAVSVGEEEVVPDLSGIDLLIRVEGFQRKTGTFTFDDMDEVATDLATVQNIIAMNPPQTTPMPGMVPMDDGVNGMINHAFDIHNRSGDTDPLIQRYVPPTVAGLVGFDLGMRTYQKGTLAIEIVVEVTDAAGGRVMKDHPIKLDGTMWITPDANLSAPSAQVR